MMKIVTKTELICPKCGSVQAVEMPIDACQFFYECAHCKTMLRPETGDCCVFCSFGSVPCPSKQSEMTA